MPASNFYRAVIRSIGSALSVALVCLSAGASEERLPDIGSSISRVLSPQQEQLVGDDYMQQLRQLAPIIDDPELVSYINDLGYRLVSSSPDAQDRAFYFFVIQDNSLNAFALPGGYIGVHSTLMLMADSESELGGVLAHEIAHVTQRHLARRLEKASQISFPTLAAILGGLIFAAANPQAGIALAMGAQAGAQQFLINHTRENESEADRIGMHTMADVDLDPNGMASFFEKMEQTTRYMRLPPPVLLTHPVTQQRIADARSRAADLPAKRPEENLRFRLMQAKLRDSSLADIKQHEREVQHLQKESPTDVVTHYRNALLALRLHDYALAETEAKFLRATDTNNISYILLLNQIWQAQQRGAEAEALLETALRLHPAHHALTVAYSQHLLQTNRAARARELLLAYVSQPEREPNVYQLLASAQQAAGFSDEVHESQGLYLQAVGDLRGALQQFELARRSRSNDPFATTRINARIKHIQEILFERRRRS